MDISRIDYWAVCGTSRMHRASVISKVLATAFIIATVVVAKNIVILVAAYILILATVRLAELPVTKILMLSLFPGLFALLFAFSQAGAGMYLPVLIIMKAVTAASVMLLLISTTPYMDVLGLLGRLLPRVIRDGLFMTYRSFFILFELMSHFLTALRLRGGITPGRLIVNAANISAGIGIMFIRAYEKSERLYNIMHIRGYSGRIVESGKVSSPSLSDLPYLIISMMFFAGSLVVMPGELDSRPFIALITALGIYIVGMEASRHWKR